MQNTYLHKDFTLNENSFATTELLLDYAKKLSPSIYTFLKAWFNEDDVVIVKTSGSTGKPKDIQLKKKHMVNSALATGEYFNLPAKTKTLLCISTNFIAGKMMLVRALILGWDLDVVDTGSNPLQNLEQTYDFCAMVPLQLYNSLDKLSYIKKLIVGGGVVSKELEEKLQVVNTEVFATYGMTETITHIAVKSLNRRHAELVSASYYQVLPDVKISKDSRGCLVINAPKVSDELVVTNDLVEITSEIEFKWLGRYDNIINSGGIKLLPELIEDKLSAVIDCRFFVAGVADEVLGEKLILVIESDIEETILLRRIQNLSTLQRFEVPKEVYFLSKFLDTENGKIRREETLKKIFG